jgi:hypothetical protein
MKIDSQKIISWFRFIGKICIRRLDVIFFLLFLLGVIYLDRNPEAFEITSNSSDFLTPLSPPDPSLHAEELLFTQDDFSNWVGPFYSGVQIEQNVYERYGVKSYLFASIFTIERPRSYKDGDIYDPRRASQSITIFKTAEMAYADYEKVEKIHEGHFNINDYYYLQEFHPKIDNITWSCGEAYTPDYGEYLNCRIFMQSGVFFINSAMYVDGKVFTLDDWEMFVNVLHDKLVAHQNKYGIME